MIVAVCPSITPNGPVSALTAAVLKFVSHNPGGFNADNAPIEYPTSTG